MTIIRISLNCTEATPCGNLTWDELGDLNQQELFVYKNLPNMILIMTYIPLFLIALISNVLVIITVSRYRSLRSVTNYFLVNLSISDLLITLVCMPMAVGQSIYSLWIYGEIMCKLTHYLKGVSVSASVFTIAAMSIDRYMAIRHPMSRKIINRRTTTKIILVIWCLALLIFSPILYVRRPEGYKLDWDPQEYVYCIEVWPHQFSQKTFGIVCFVTVYLIPGLIVIMAYSLMGLRLCSRQLLPEYEISHGPANGTVGGEAGHSSSNSAWQVSAVGGRLIRERRRVAKILLVLALVFAFCWLPYSVLSLILDLNAKPPPSLDEELLHEYAEGNGNEELTTIANLLLPFAILLGHSQAAVNPLVYCILSKNFRRSVTDLIRHPTRALRTRQHCKIRMTFRKDPPPSMEPNSSERPISRPRNHFAPDPPPKSSHCSMGTLMEQAGDIRLAEMIAKPNHSNNHLDVVVAYSPTASTFSSSGYSSLRASDNSSCSHQWLSSQTLPCGVAHCSYCSASTSPGSYIPGCASSSQCHCQVHTSSFIFTKKGILCNDHRKVDVPSTICEESENSFLSQRSKTSSKVCFG